MSDVEERIKFFRRIIDKKLNYRVVELSNGKALLFISTSIKLDDYFSDLISFTYFKEFLEAPNFAETITNSLENSESLESGWILLHKNETIRALIYLLSEKGYFDLPIRLLEYVGEKYLKPFTDELWKFADLLTANILLKLLILEGKESKALPILLEQKKRKIMSLVEEERFAELSLKFKIEDEFFELQEMLETVDKKDFSVALESIKSDTEERIKLIESSAIKRHNEILTRIKEHDFFLTSERKEGLQKQIDITQKGLDRIQMNMRLFLIIMSIVFTALTGTFIGLLVHILNIIS